MKIIAVTPSDKLPALCQLHVGPHQSVGPDVGASHKPFPTSSFKESSMQNSSRRKFTTLLAALSLTAAASFAHAAEAPHVALKTSMGDIVLELNPEKAPKSVENFLRYVKDGQYNGTIFHRVIDGFMIQGGGFDANMQQKPTREPIPNEAKNGLKNTPYTVAMARTAAPHSASAQFFINVGNNDGLNFPGQDGWGYAVFGKVIKGTEVVDKIRQVKTGNSGMYRDVPTTPVVIESASIVK
jgi:cyclophilin family peptidyl-prolyl cis-trans isomerase